MHLHNFLQGEDCMNQQYPFHRLVDFYESLLKNKCINEVYFLQDGLHLSAEGYQVLRKAIDEKLDHLI